MTHGYIPDRYAYVALNSYLALFDTQHRNASHVISTDTRDVGRFLDVIFIVFKLRSSGFRKWQNCVLPSVTSPRY